MIDLGKIDFSRLTLPDWNEQCVTCKRGPLGLELKRFHHRFAHRSLDACGAWQYCGTPTWNELEVAKTYTDRVDAFIAEESARPVREKNTAPRPCTREFALGHPNESEYRYWTSWDEGGSARGAWSDWLPLSEAKRTTVFYGCEFRTTASECTVIPDLEVTASDPPPLVVGLGVQLRKGVAVVGGDHVCIDDHGRVKFDHDGAPIGDLVIRL